MNKERNDREEESKSRFGGVTNDLQEQFALFPHPSPLCLILSFSLCLIPLRNALCRCIVLSYPPPTSPSPVFLSVSVFVSNSLPFLFARVAQAPCPVFASGGLLSKNKCPRVRNRNGVAARVLAALCLRRMDAAASVGARARAVGSPVAAATGAPPLPEALRAWPLCAANYSAMPSHPRRRHRRRRQQKRRLAHDALHDQVCVCVWRPAC